MNLFLRQTNHRESYQCITGGGLSTTIFVFRVLVVISKFYGFPYDYKSIILKFFQPLSAHY